MGGWVCGEISMYAGRLVARQINTCVSKYVCKSIASYVND